MRKTWDNDSKKRWWSENWEEVEWAVPKGLDLAPVVFVDYTDATAYCEWAGVRLPSEEEWIHSARAGKDQWFPWGDDWEAQGHAHTQEIGRTKLWELVRENAFPAYRIGNGRNGPLRFRRTEVLAWLDRNRVTPESTGKAPAPRWE